MSFSLVVSDKEEYEGTVRKWVIVERQLKLIHDKTKELREMKCKLSDKISQYIEKNNIEEIETSEGKIKPVERKEYTPLTYGYLEKSLEKMISDKSKVQQIISLLKNNREMKVSKELILK